MRNFVSYRITAHSCLYFAAVMLTRIFVFDPFPTFVTAGLILAASFIAVRFEKAWARALISLVPAAGLLFANGPLQLIALALPVVYLALTMTLNRMETELWQFKKEFGLISCLLLVILAISLFLAFTSAGELFYPVEAAHRCWLMIGLALFFGFMALRALRAGNVRSFKWQAGNSLLFIAAVAAGLVFGLFLRFGLLPVLNVLTMIVISPLAIVLFASVKFGELFMRPALDIHSIDPETMPPSVDYQQETQPELTELPKGLFNFRKFSFNVELPWRTIGIALILIAAIALMVIVILTSRKRRALHSEKRSGAIVSDEGLARRGRKRRKTKQQGCAESIRYIYRQYLSFLHLHGIMPERSRTSGEISERANRILLETDEVFRSLYRKARYGSEAEVTEEDVRMAEEAYERLVNDANLRPKQEQE